MNDIKAIPISPVMMNVMPTPFNAGGMAEYSRRSRIAAMPTIAMSHPIPDPKAKQVTSPMLL